MDVDDAYATPAVDAAAVVDTYVPVAVLGEQQDVRQVWQVDLRHVGRRRRAARQRVELRDRTVVQQLTPEYDKQQCYTITRRRRYFSS